MSVPRVSVLMPVHNGEAFLRAAVDSILNQTMADFELIVVDDGSTDGSRSILDAYQQADPRIRLVLKDRKEGIPKGLNDALDLAQSELVARFDCDDISMPHRLQTQMDWLARHDEVNVVGSWAWLIDETGKRRWRVKKQPSGAARLRRLLPLHNCLLHPATMFRKSAALKAGNYDSRFLWAQDYDLWLRMLVLGDLDNLPEPLIEMRRHADQVSEPSKRRSSTLFSVAAGINHLCRKHGVRELADLTLSGGRNFAETGAALFAAGLDAEDKDHLERHLIRLRRYTFTSGAEAEDLTRALVRSGGLFARNKMRLYDFIG